MRTPDQEAMIQQAIAQGPITEAYHADPQQIVQIEPASRHRNHQLFAV